MKKKYANAEIVPEEPALFPSGYGRRLPRKITGATIIRIGRPKEQIAHLEGGGLIIDYRPKGSEKTYRAVFAFTELGMWIVANGKIKDSSSLA
jgi:hypothetical protein